VAVAAVAVTQLVLMVVQVLLVEAMAHAVLLRVVQELLMDQVAAVLMKAIAVVEQQEL
jgi:hypothetical protein